MAEGRTITIVQKGKAVEKKKIYITADAYCQTSPNTNQTFVNVYLKDENGSNWNNSLGYELRFLVYYAWDYPMLQNYKTVYVTINSGSSTGRSEGYSGNSDVLNCTFFPHEAWIMESMPTSDDFEFINSTTDPR